MPKRNRAREGRNLTAERKARAEGRGLVVRDLSADPTTLEAIRSLLTFEKEIDGETKTFNRAWIGGSTMEEILRAGDAETVTVGLIEAVGRGARIEQDAQEVLKGASEELRSVIGQAFVNAAASGDYAEGQSRFMHAFGTRLQPRKAVSEKPSTPAPAANVPPPRNLFVDGDSAELSEAIVSAKFLDEAFKTKLMDAAEARPEMAEELASMLADKGRSMRADAENEEDTAKAEKAKKRAFFIGVVLPRFLKEATQRKLHEGERAARERDEVRKTRRAEAYAAYKAGDIKPHHVNGAQVILIVDGRSETFLDPDLQKAEAERRQAKAKAAKAEAVKSSKASNGRKAA